MMSELAGHKQNPAPGSAFELFKWIIVFALLSIAVVGNTYFSDFPLLYRVLGIVSLSLVAVGVSAATIKGKWVIGLFRDARAELRRVVWPSRQETFQTTLGVVVMVLLVAVFLWLLDMLLSWGISYLIS